MVSWDEIDTVLLDMDGTLIDLNFDNTLWNEYVPQHYAAAQGIEPWQASDLLYGKTINNQTKIDYYSVDFWKQRTRLEIDRLHHALAYLIRYRPRAEAFIQYVRAKRRRAVIATNAHPNRLGS